MVARARYRQWTLSVGFVAYAILMTALFFFVLFPYDMLQRRLVYGLSHALIASVEVGSSKLMIPAGMAWQDIQIGLTNGVRFYADLVEFDIDLGSMFRGRPRLKATVQRRNGEPLFETELELSSYSIAAEAQLIGRVKQLELPSLSAGSLRTGLLQGGFVYQWDNFWSNENFLKGKGTLNIDVAGIVLGNVPVMLGGPTNISTLHAELECASGLCRILEMHGKGIGEQLSGEGTLMLRIPVQQSMLAVTLWLTDENTSISRPGEVVAKAPQGLKLHVNGPLEHLRMSL